MLRTTNDVKSKSVRERFLYVLQQLSEGPETGQARMPVLPRSDCLQIELRAQLSDARICVSPTSPNRLLLKLPFGLVNCVWLNMLKNSARTSTAIDSVMATLFAIPKSVLRIPGPWKNRRAEVPKVPRTVFFSHASLRKKRLLPSASRLRGSVMTTYATRFGWSALLPVSE